MCITEVELVSGTVLSVTVYDARQVAVPSAVANMAVRAGIGMAELGRSHRHLSSFFLEPVPVFIWGLRDDVNQLVASYEAHMVGSRAISLYLFLRPKLAGSRHGFRFRELTVTVIGSEGSLQPQVSFTETPQHACSGIVMLMEKSAPNRANEQGM